MQSRRRQLVVIVCAAAVLGCTAVLGTLAGRLIEAVAVCLPAAVIVGHDWRMRGAVLVAVATVLGFLMPALISSRVFLPASVGSVLVSAVILAAFAVMGARESLLVERAYHTAGRDPLTGLLNRNRFLELLASESNRARRLGTPLAVAFIDLDDFKALNDSQGHLAGDEILQAVADVLRRDVRNYDGIARMGGDEFALCYPGADEQGVRIALERAERDLTQTSSRFGSIVSFSIGAAVFLNPPDAESMLRAADRLMYEAKRDGKGSIIVRAADGTVPARVEG